MKPSRDARGSAPTHRCHPARRDLPQRTVPGARHDRNDPTKKRDGLPPWSVHPITNQERISYVTILWKYCTLGTGASPSLRRHGRLDRFTRSPRRRGRAASAALRCRVPSGLEIDDQLTNLMRVVAPATSSQRTLAAASAATAATIAATSAATIAATSAAASPAAWDKDTNPWDGTSAQMPMAASPSAVPPMRPCGSGNRRHSGRINADQNDCRCTTQQGPDDNGRRCFSCEHLVTGSTPASLAYSTVALPAIY